MAFDFDVVIAGGGPAGSSTANLLCQRKRKVLLLERDRFPRFHIGESMLPFANDIWKELGVFEKMDAMFIHKPGAKFVHEESGAEFTYYFDTAIRPGRPYAFQLKRAEFDLMLLEHAASLGACVRQETRVADVDFAADGVTVKCERAGEKYQVTAPVFVDATGRDALIANRRQLKETDGLVTTNVAVHTMYRDVERDPGEDEGNIIIGLFGGGWWWVIPFKDGDTSVGMVLEKDFSKLRRGASTEELFEAGLSATPHLRGRLARARRTFSVEAQGNWSYRSRLFYGDRLLMVGDSAAFVDPLFSTGVLFAVHGAKFAAEHLDRALTDGDFRAERFQTYQEQCVAGMDIFKGLVHEFYAENLRRVLMASAHNPTVCSAITSMLAGDVYKRSMWHSLVKKGFSHHAEVEGVPGVKSSRELMEQAGRLDKQAD
ncbi:MAG: NAD(P)/FAD-dependent oxidoreductase [Polyangia bacterium]